MKSYTNLEQSRKLAEILPLESADMCYRAYREEGGILDYQVTLCPYQFASWIGVPCWSLAALLEVIGVECRMEKTPLDQSGVFTYSFVDDYYNIRTFEEDNAVDAAVEMIYKLKEKNLL